jgi:hypothetical protein
VGCLRGGDAGQRLQRDLEARVGPTLKSPVAFATLSGVTLSTDARPAARIIAIR